MSVTNANEFESALHGSNSKSGGLSATFQKIFQAMVNARMNEARVHIVQVLRQRSDAELTAMGYTGDDITNIRAGRFVVISN